MIRGVVVTGGQVAIVHAGVTLYAGGNVYHGGATVIATGTSDSGGGFTFTFNPATGCPAANPNAQTYVVATGGDAGGGTNSAIGLMSFTGPCSSLSSSTFVVVNELTTAAAQWSGAPFIDPTGTNLGTSSTNVLGLTNSVTASQNNLVVSYLPSGGTPSNVGVPANFLPTAALCASGSPPINCDGLKRLDTMANILAACDTSSGPSSTPCSTLFTATGTNTTMLAAAHAIVTNPVTNVNTIYAVQATPSTTAPYQPALSSAPSDLTLPLNFRPNGANFNDPFTLAIDGTGAVWVPNSAGDSVTKLTSSGALAGNFTGGGLSFPNGVAIDTSGNVWVTNSGSSSVTQFNSSGGAATNLNPPAANFSAPIGIAIDTSGNVWAANLGGGVSELLAGCTSTSCTAFNINPPESGLGSGAYALAIDPLANIWVTNLDSFDNYFNQLSNCSGGNCPVSAFSPTGTTPGGAFGIAVDASGNLWIPSFYNLGVAKIAAGCSTASCTGQMFATGAEPAMPSSVAIDSGGNAWVTNENDTDSSISELTASGAVVGVFAPPGADFDDPDGVAIDASGNVWVSNCASSSANCNSGTSGSVSELVGAAGPVMTPLVACLTQPVPSAVCLP